MSNTPFLIPAALASELLTRLTEGVLLFDAEGSVLFGNPALQRILALNAPPAGTVRDLFAADTDLGAVIFGALDGEPSVDRDLQYSPADSDARWLRVSACALEQGSPPPVLLVVLEISELKRAEREMWQVEKMSALGRLAASVAHEVRNPLGAVDIQLQLMQEDLARLEIELPVRLTQRLITARAEMRRLDGIVQNFLRFSRPPALHLQLVAPDDLLGHIIALVEPEARERQIELELQLARDLPKVLVDENLLSQAILNILINAFQAVEENPLVVLSTALDRERDRYEIRIRDNGVGILPADLERIFEYYYTTKDTGTGLGLSIAQRIVHQHRGILDVESTVGTGTTVMIDLPLN